MARRTLRPQLNQIRGWMRQGRTDEWIFHQLDVTVEQLRRFKFEQGLDEDDAAIAAELEQELESRPRRRSQRPPRHQLRRWIEQGRTDAWIAHQLEVTIQEVQQLKREHGLEEETERRAEQERRVAQHAAFFSYARRDDEYDSGQIRRLGHALEGEMRAQLGGDFQVFLDRGSVTWGAGWKERVDESRDADTLLIPIVTPGFFASAECRRELERFMERERELGRHDLVLPLYYVTAPQLDDPDRDELASALSERQLVDWRELRFEPLTSPDVRRRLAELASLMLTRFTRPAEARRPSRRTPSIFVSYRRTDVPGHAGRLYDRFVDRFGEPNVFKDLDTMEPGADFVEVIEETVARCDALIAVIGPNWLGAEEGGRRRLDDPQDWVRLEIANALQRRIRVIPVLVQGAAMPRATDLPEDLQQLARRHAIELTESAWSAQVSRLIDAVQKPLGTQRA